MTKLRGKTAVGFKAAGFKAANVQSTGSKASGTKAGEGKRSGFIETEKDISAGVKALRRACPVMRHAHDIAGNPPLRRRPGGFDGLARIIVGQQLSTASAAAIWGRLEGAMETVTPVRILAAGDGELRSAGLSAAKIATLRAAAVAATGGSLAIDRLDQLDDASVHEMLCAVKGIGPWTADIYILFCLGRADAFAVGDLALQIAAGHASGRPNRPTPAELAEMAERWRPWRGVAARLLWAYYPHMKSLGNAAGRTGAVTSEPV